MFLLKLEYTGSITPSFRALGIGLKPLNYQIESRDHAVKPLSCRGCDRRLYYMMLRYHNARAVSKLPDSLFPVLRTQGVTRTDIYKTTITTILLTKPLFYYTTSTIFCLHQQSDNQTSLNCKIKFYSFFPRWILHLHELHLLLHIFYDSSASADGGRRRIMSKYIPGNHKHLTTQDRLYRAQS